MNKFSLIAMGCLTFMVGADAQEWNHKTDKFKRGEITLGDRAGRQMQQSLNVMSGNNVASTPPMVVVENAANLDISGEIAYLVENDMVALKTEAGPVISIPIDEFETDYSYTEFPSTGTAQIVSWNNQSMLFYYSREGHYAFRYMAHSDRGDEGGLGFCEIEYSWFRWNEAMRDFPRDIETIMRHRSPDNGPIDEVLNCDYDRVVDSNHRASAHGFSYDWIERIRFRVSNYDISLGLPAFADVSYRCLGVVTFPNGQVIEDSPYKNSEALNISETAPVGERLLQTQASWYRWSGDGNIYPNDDAPNTVLSCDYHRFPKYAVFGDDRGSYFVKISDSRYAIYTRAGVVRELSSASNDVIPPVDNRIGYGYKYDHPTYSMVMTSGLNQEGTILYLFNSESEDWEAVQLPSPFQRVLYTDVERLPAQSE